ncbi:hypothetical protein LUW74_28905 [Actinomadura madurae]|nr:hypothetical protein [Actinomadura madurae]URN06943.1 hypothetical protein LUW74_28905 [Actinomadura madurae]
MRVSSVVVPAVAETAASATGSPVAASVTVPDSVPSPALPARIRDSASSLPSPKALLSSEVPPHCSSRVSMEVRSSRVRVASRSRAYSGSADHSSATAPATCGVAIDVPDITPYALPGIADRTSTPGAETLGLSRPSWPGPRLENDAIALSWS